MYISQPLVNAVNADLIVKIDNLDQSTGQFGVHFLCMMDFSSKTFIFYFHSERELYHLEFSHKLGLAEIFKWNCDTYI